MSSPVYSFPLGALSSDLKLQMATCLPLEPAVSLTQVCRSMRSLSQGVRFAHAANGALAQKILANYRSPEPIGQYGPVTAREKVIQKLSQANQVPSTPQIEATKNILQASLLPNAGFDANTLSILDSYLGGLHLEPEYPPTAFGPDKWNRYIGQVQHVPVPPDVQAKLLSPCPVFGVKTVGQTHTLTYIPPEVDGQPLTLNRFMTYIQHTKNGGKSIKLNIYWQEILKKYGDKPITPGWFFMLKTYLPGTKNKPYPEQLEVLHEFQRTNPEYREPNAMEAAVSTLMEYIQSGDSDTRLFSDEYIRMSDVLKGYRLTFGGFGPDGPRIGILHGYYFAHASGIIGLGVVLPCGSSPAIGT